MSNVQSIEAPAYGAPDNDDDQVVERAKRILRDRLLRQTTAFDSPQAVKDYLQLQVAELEHEVFGVLWLDSQHRLITDQRLFNGTLNQASVFPREVVKAALKVNAGACILYHNHPSGSPEPSRADEHLTQSLKQALALVDVRVLDHVVVGFPNTVSFAERGLL